MSWILIVLALLGHGYVLMLSLNIVYAQRFHRKLLKAQRQLWGLLLLAVPTLFGVFVGTDLPQLLNDTFESRRFLLPAVYAGICVVFGLAFIVVTISRALRRPPLILLKEESRIVDIEKELGHRPVGDGKHRHVAARRINDIFRVEYSHLELQVPGLPAAWDGLTILHLSDLHFYGTPSPEYFHFALKHAMADGVPDLLVISGDIIDEQKYLDWIEPILSPLRWNIAAFAILGNHDWWQDFEGVCKRLSALGMTVLHNRWTQLDVRGESMIAIGHEGPWFRPAPDLAECPQGFRLLISHTPDNIGWAKRNDCKLMLSGHNHGGQIRLPIVGSLFVPSKFSRKYDMGTFHESPTVLHVNRGLSGKEPIRFRCLPQVSRITLRVASANGGR